jgi:hypothetical protein
VPLLTSTLRALAANTRLRRRPSRMHRFTESLIDVKIPYWSYTFLGAEMICMCGLFVGHFSRSYPIHRERVTMDDLVEADAQVNALRLRNLDTDSARVALFMCRA